MNNRTSPVRQIAFYTLLAVSSVGACMRTTMLVPLTTEPSWRDFAFLAAVPAATVADDGAPSLIALDDTGKTKPEIEDYARRYRPEVVYLLGGTIDDLVVAGKACTPLRANSADEAACVLSKTFWSAAATAVICSETDYEAGLVAAALAARLRAPLLFATTNGLSLSAGQKLGRLNARELIVIGNLGTGLQALKQLGKPVVELADAHAVMAWVRKKGLRVAYIAALNPTDRNRTVIKKTSLAGALLAAGRQGLVAPLTYETRWKIPFTGVELKDTPPAGVPTSKTNSKAGHIVLDGREYGFVLTGEHMEANSDDLCDLRVTIDVNGNGAHNDPAKGSFTTGDTVELGGKRYVITLGTKNGVGEADVRLTWPSADRLCEHLRTFYQALGAPPEHLCLVGFPDAITQAIIGGDDGEDLTSDLPYANADNDPFAEIAVARVIAENVSFATLYASRVLTYRALLAPEWQDRACLARWENTCGKLFENVGFDASYHHTEEDLKWIVPPAEGTEGERAQTFVPDSPLARCAVLAHDDHSGWQGLGNTFDWDADVLLAPVVIESGGCLTAALDREPDFRSVIARMFRKGAVSFSGNSREGVAECELQRHEFWNGVLSGQTIGQAHRRSINSALVTILDQKETTGGCYWYQLRIRTQFGDPAFAPRVPRAPDSAPARVTVHGNTVSVHAPQQWWPIKATVPEDWKQWCGKDLYVLRGAGAYALKTWCSEGHDIEEIFVTAEFTTRSRVARIEQVQQPPSPLGWRGTWHVDEHADGSRTCRWAVRMVDFDQIKGHIINAVDRLDYRISYE